MYPWDLPEALKIEAVGRTEILPATTPTMLAFWARTSVTASQSGRRSTCLGLLPIFDTVLALSRQGEIIANSFYERPTP